MEKILQCNCQHLKLYLSVFSDPKVRSLFSQELQVINCKSLHSFSWVIFQVLKEEL